MAHTGPIDPETRSNLFIRLSHTGRYADGRPNISPVLINDLDVGYENSYWKVPCYVPVGGSISILATTKAFFSFEQGVIRKFSDAGVIHSHMFFKPESYNTTADLPDPTEFPAGTFVWNEADLVAYWSNGTSWQAGSMPPGSVTFPDLGEVSIPGGPYPSIAALTPVAIMDGGFVPADAGILVKAPAVGVYTGATTNRIRKDGILTGLSGLTPSGPVYLAEGGGYTHVPPVGAGKVSQYLGQALNSTTLFLAIQTPVFL